MCSGINLPPLNVFISKSYDHGEEKSDEGNDISNNADPEIDDELL